MSDHNNNSLEENPPYPARRQAPALGENRRPRKHRNKKRRFGVVGMILKALGTLILVGLCTGALLCCFAAVYINEVIIPEADLSLDDIPLGEDSIMYYQDKESGRYVEMTSLLNITSTIWVDLEEMPEDLINAAVAIEDHRFWTHPGIDWRRTGRAVLDMFLGNDISGGSTITQQLIKNRTGYNETTVKRKITEIVRAIRFTKNNTKEDTIELYLNIIPLGSGCEGVGAAALEYFGKPVSQLTLAECAALVRITNNPSKYGPNSFAKIASPDGTEMWTARQWNKYGQEVVLGRMLQLGYITQEEHDQAVAQELVFVQDEGEAAETQIYSWYEETVIADVSAALREQFGWSEQRINQALQKGGLRIYTCYDPKAQAIVDEIYTDRANLDYTSKDGQLMQSTITVIDNATGDVVAIAGQFGEKTGNLWKNHANEGSRQPGSSLKPLSVYSPAIEFGRISPVSVFDDYPYEVMGGKAWPLNSGTTKYMGKVTVAEALRRSLNTVAVRILSDVVTPEESFHFVQDKYHIDLEEGRDIDGKIYSDMARSPMAMGGLTDGTNTREMATAYSTFPNNGTFTQSRTFTRVTQMVDGREEVLLDNELFQENVIKPTTAYYMNSMLQNVFTGAGTASGHGLKGQHAAGKTGTTSDNNDRWFVGYTPYYTCAVWTGYAQPRKMSLSTNPPLALWEKVMTRLHEGLENRDYPVPADLRTITYCLDSGLPASEWCTKDPRGSRTAKGSIFPEDYPEAVLCDAHKAESVVRICVDDPVLDESGAQTGRYHLAGPYCPEVSIREYCYPNYPREPVGSAAAGDEIYRYEHNSNVLPCSVHGAPVEEPDPILPPFDPNYPGGGFDPTNPVNPVDPSDPGGTTDPEGTGDDDSEDDLPPPLYRY